MAFRTFYAIVVNGVEVKRRIRPRDARYHAGLLREVHGMYNVWLRPHAELVAV
jgi:hypothetical protein